MSICITIRHEDSPEGFERFLSKFMARYYPSVQVRFGAIEDIVLSGEPSNAEVQAAWMLLDAAGAEHFEQQLQLA